MTQDLHLLCGKSARTFSHHFIILQNNAFNIRAHLQNKNQSRFSVFSTFKMKRKWDLHGLIQDLKLLYNLSHLSTFSGGNLFFPSKLQEHVHGLDEIKECFILFGVSLWLF